MLSWSIEPEFWAAFGLPPPPPEAPPGPASVRADRRGGAGQRPTGGKTRGAAGAARQGALPAKERSAAGSGRDGAAEARSC